MEMVYCLSCKFTVVLNYVESLDIKRFLYVLGNLYCKFEKSAGCFFVNFKYVGIMLFGKNKRMSYVSGKSVKYYLKFVIFINCC